MIEIALGLAALIALDLFTASKRRNRRTRYTHQGHPIGCP